MLASLASLLNTVDSPLLSYGKSSGQNIYEIKGVCCRNQQARVSILSLTI